MNTLAEKVRHVEADIAREKGPLNLFALFEREDINRWDLVISAPWAAHDHETLKYIADVIKRHLTPEEMTLLARMVILPADEDPVLALNASFDASGAVVAYRRARDGALRETAWTMSIGVTVRP